MANVVPQYKYYIDGQDLIILEKDSDTGVYITPATNYTNGILLRYTVANTPPTSISDELGLSRRLEMAIVDYVKYRLYENAGDDRRAQFYYRKFLSALSREVKNRRGHFRKIIPNYTGVIK